MAPYEIRQLSDGSIDYNNYYARPVSLTSPEMLRFYRRIASLRGAMVAAAAVMAITASVLVSQARIDCAQCATIAAR